MAQQGLEKMDIFARLACAALNSGYEETNFLNFELKQCLVGTAVIQPIIAKPAVKLHLEYALMVAVGIILGAILMGAAVLTSMMRFARRQNAALLLGKLASILKLDFAYMLCLDTAVLR